MPDVVMVLAAKGFDTDAISFALERWFQLFTDEDASFRRVVPPSAASLQAPAGPQPPRARRVVAHTR